MTPEQGKRLAAYLGEYAEDVVREWMRIIEIRGYVLTPGSDDETQARVNWHGETFAVGTSVYGEEFGHYRMKVTVEPVDVPPIGPENDLGVYGIDDREPATAVILEPPQWIAAQWRHVLAGDRIRLGPSVELEAEVATALPQNWMAKITSKQLDSGRWWDKIEAWQHIMIKTWFNGRPKPFEFQAAAPVEILMSPERRTTHAFIVDSGAVTESWPAEVQEWNRKVMAQEGQPTTYAQHMAAASRTGAQSRGSHWTRPGASRPDNAPKLGEVP